MKVWEVLRGQASQIGLVYQCEYGALKGGCPKRTPASRDLNTAARKSQGDLREEGSRQQRWVVHRL